MAIAINQLAMQSIQSMQQSKQQCNASSRTCSDGIEQEKCEMIAAMLIKAIRNELGGLYDHKLKQEGGYDRELAGWTQALLKRKAHLTLKQNAFKQALNSMAFDLGQRGLQCKKSVLDYLLGPADDGLDAAGSGMYGLIARADAERQAKRVAHASRLIDKGKREKDLSVGNDWLAKMRSKGRSA